MQVPTRSLFPVSTLSICLLFSIGSCAVNNNGVGDGGINGGASGGHGSGGTASGTGGGATATGGATASGGATGSRTGGASGSATGGMNGSGGAGVVGSGGGGGGAGIGGPATGGVAVGTGGASSSGGMTGQGGNRGGTGGAGAATSYFRRGINLGNRLDAPSEGAWGPTLNAADFPRIAQRGFDHIRLPVRFNAHAGAAAPYTVDATFFDRVDWAIKQALDAGLAIIVDFHHYDEIHLDPAAHQDRFVAIWTQIAGRYRDQSPRVAFELLNEPSGMLTAAAWNTIAARALAAVRQTNPTRLVIIDSTNFAAAATLPMLQVGASADPNVMAEVHLYEPSLFAFQGQAWMGPIWATTKVVFPGPPATPLIPVQAAQNAPWAQQWFADYNTLPADQNPSGLKTILAQVQFAREFTQRTGRPVYNGEWGPQNGADTVSRVRFMRAMREECEKAGITWAIWDDATNLKLFDSATGLWDATLTAPLFP